MEYPNAKPDPKPAILTQMTAPYAPTAQNRTELVRQFATNLGFDVCGFASVGEPIDPENRLNKWIAAGYHADLDWLTRTVATRQDVRLKLPGAQTVVVLAKNYYSERPTPPKGSARVARYAWGRDYHRVLRRPLIRLAQYIDTFGNGAKSYASIDAGPIMERAWAQRAGVAAIGKNSLGLRRDLGSWFFLATILTNVSFQPDVPAEEICGTCTLCIDACPTRAIVAPRVVDAGRCISYQTIENRGEVPREIAEAHGDWVFGCDICQEVCPWNRFAKSTSDPAFLPRPGQANPTINSLITMTDSDFHTRFAGSPLRRAKRTGMLRNARIVRANRARRARKR